MGHRSPALRLGPYDHKTLLHDRFGLEPALQAGLPRVGLPPGLPAKTIMRDFGTSRLFRLGLRDLINAAGRSVIAHDGRLASVPDPTLIWTFTRFAPVHSLMYVAAMFDHKGASGLEPSITRLLDTMLSIYRMGIALGIHKQVALDALPTLQLSDEETMEMMAAIVSGGDLKGTPFPVNNWYSS